MSKVLTQERYFGGRRTIKKIVAFIIIIIIIELACSICSLIFSIVQLVPVNGQLNCTQWRKLNAYDIIMLNQTKILAII